MQIPLHVKAAQWAATVSKEMYILLLKYMLLNEPQRIKALQLLSTYIKIKKHTQLCGSKSRIF